MKIRRFIRKRRRRNAKRAQDQLNAAMSQAKAFWLRHIK